MAGETGLTPTERELDFIVSLGSKVEEDIDGSVTFVRFGADIEVFGVEMT